MGLIAQLLLKLLGEFWSVLPRAGQRILGHVLGLLLYALRWRRLTLRGNLARFSSDPGQRRKIERDFYRHIGTLIWECLLVLDWPRRRKQPLPPGGSLQKFVRARVSLRGAEHIRQAYAQGRGIFYLASHLGNWELLGGVHAESFAAEFPPLLFVTKRLRPHWLHRALEMGRKRLRVEAVYEPQTLKKIINHLRQNGSVGFVLDQYTGPPVGIRVPFFGVPVGTHAALATLVKRTQTPVLYVENHRTPTGDWIVEISSPLPWITHKDPACEIAHNTAAYAARIEASIRLYPGQWSWSHRRFKGNLAPLSEAEWVRRRPV